MALGEDEALTLLYQLIGFDPKLDPAQLYGAEKDWIVRHIGLWHVEEQRGRAGWPSQLENLDIVAERLTRAAYLHDGTSEPMKAEIRADQTKPDYGSLITALRSTRLNSAAAELEVLHGLRSTKTYAHISTKLTDDEMTSAREAFKRAAKTLVGTLKEARRGT